MVTKLVLSDAVLSKLAEDTLKEEKIETRHLAPLTNTDPLKDSATVDLCERGHYFLKLPDHPRSPSTWRSCCPYCMAIGLYKLQEETFVRVRSR